MRTQKKRKASKSFYIIALSVLIGAGLITAAGINSKEEPKKTVSEPELSDSAEIGATPELQENESTPPIIIEEPEEEPSMEPTISEEPETEETEEAAANEVVTFQIPIDATIIKNFDLERHQFSKTFGDMRRHSGIDILAVAGTPALITANGTVKSITEDPMMGTIVTLSHAGGYESIYCGLEDIKYNEGDEVKIGSVLGVVGEIPSEILDEDHLHFEIKKDGQTISPLEAFNMY